MGLSTTGVLSLVVGTSSIIDDESVSIVVSFTVESSLVEMVITESVTSTAGRSVGITLSGTWVMVSWDGVLSAGAAGIDVSITSVESLSVTEVVWVGISSEP